jgi:hypothetical protein
MTLSTLETHALKTAFAVVSGVWHWLIDRDYLFALGIRLEVLLADGQGFEFGVPEDGSD